MSKKVFNLLWLGRAGNQLFEYAFARGYCEMHDLELRTYPWWGDKVFDIHHPLITSELPQRDENSLIIGEGNVSYCSYSQRQRCADYYSLRQIGKWFTFRRGLSDLLLSTLGPFNEVTAHLRRGDYVGSSYPLVSVQSYFRAYPGDHSSMFWCTEEHPRRHSAFREDLSFVPDFYYMTRSKIILRANSSFSFWAAAIAMAHHGAQVYSPVISGKTGGIEQDCEFLPNNWARLAELDCVEQITIKP